jgi:hypothetical protein
MKMMTSALAMLARFAQEEDGFILIGTTGGGSEPPTEWEGPLNQQTLTVTVDEIVPDGAVSAPLSVEFVVRVTGSAVGEPPIDFEDYDPTYTRVHYVVHTGDTGNYRNERVGHSSHRNKAFQYGQNAGHVYSNAGIYTGRSVYVYDDLGAWGVATLPDLQVLTPEVVYPPSRTIVVSNTPGETWADAPPHDVANRCTTLAAAFARFLVVDGPNLGVRISLKSGTTYPEAFLTAPRQHFNHGLFDTWGGTDKAVVNMVGAASSTAGGGFFGSDNNGTFGYSVKNWSFNFGWNAADEYPINGYGTVAADMNARALFNGADKFIPTGNVGFRLTFDNLDIEGCGESVFNAVVADEFRRSAYFVNDCKLQRNMDYILFQGSNFFMLGTEVVEQYGDSLGLMGRYRTAGLQRGMKGHKSIRENSNWVIYIRACFMEGRGGWSGQEVDGGRTFYAPQPIFRLDNNGVGKTGRRIYFCDTVFMKGFALTNANSGVHAVLENCLIIHDPAHWESNPVLSNVAGGMAVRNNQFLVLNTPRILEADLAATRNVSKFDAGSQISIGDFNGRMIGIWDASTSYGRVADILHNTVAMLRPSSEIITSYSLRNTNLDGVYPVVVGHNVEYAPQLSIGPAMTTTALPAAVRVLDVWMRMAWERQEYTLLSNIGPGQTTPTIPYPQDWNKNATTQGIYTVSGNHAVFTPTTGASRKTYTTLPYAVGNGTASEVQFGRALLGAIAITFSSGGFTITNNSPDTWTAGRTIWILLDRATTPMTPDLLIDVDQAPVKLYVPTAPQALTSGVRSTLFDFTRTVRPSTTFAISPAGTNAAGALLP